MKTFMIILNTTIIAYGIHLYVGYEPLASAINRVVLEVVTGMI